MMILSSTNDGDISADSHSSLVMNVVRSISGVGFGSYQDDVNVRMGA